MKSPAKAKARLATVIDNRVAEFSSKWGCSAPVALRYLKFTNYCANAAGRNYQADKDLDAAVRARYA